MRRLLVVYSCLVVALTLLPFAAEAGREPGPVFTDGMWRCQKPAPLNASALFTVTRCSQGDGEGTEHGFVMRYDGEQEGEVVMKGWGKRSVNGEDVFTDAFAAIRLKDGTWAVSKRGGGFNYRIESLKATVVLSLVTEEGKTVAREFGIDKGV